MNLNRIQNRIIDYLFYSSSFIGDQLVKRLIRNSDVQLFENIEYGPYQIPQTEHCNILDIYRPKNSESKILPVFIHIHGGGFRLFSKDSHAHIAARIAKMGYVVFNINYRLAPRHPYPEGLVDTINAYKWIIANAGKYNGDLSNLHLMGESAGGNLALSLTLATFGYGEGKIVSMIDKNSVKPKFLAPICAYLEPSNSEKYRNDPEVSPWMVDRMKIIQKSYLPESLHKKQDWGLADPLVILEKLAQKGETLPSDFPRTFIGVGLKDPVMKDSQRLKICLENLGARVQYEDYAGEGHAFHAFFHKKNAKRFWNDLNKSF